MISISRMRENIPALASKDAELEALRSAVEQQFEELTGFLWAERTAYVAVLENSLRGEERDTVWVPLAPVTALTLVEEKMRSPGAAWSTVASTDYELVGQRRLNKLTGDWADLVRVTLTGGYSDTTCPADLQNALLVQAKLLQARTSDTMIALSQQAVEKTSANLLAPDLHPLFAQAVRSRRRKF